MRLLPLPGRKNCDRVRVKGRLWKGRHLYVRWLPGLPYHLARQPDGPAVFVGTLASTKLDKSAVGRNRMRRRCREALRLALAQFDNRTLWKGSREDARLAGPASGALLEGKDGSRKGTDKVPFRAFVQLLLLPRSSSL